MLNVSDVFSSASAGPFVRFRFISVNNTGTRGQTEVVGMGRDEKPSPTSQS